MSPAAPKPPKPVLYLDLVGTVMIDKGGEYSKAAFAPAFLDAIKNKFRIRVLSSLDEVACRTIAKSFGIEAEYISYPRKLGKTSAIDFHDNFYWIDDDPSPSDLLKLADSRCSDRVIPVNRREGITEATLKKLLSTLEQHAASKA